MTEDNNELFEAFTEVKRQNKLLRQSMVESQNNETTIPIEDYQTISDENRRLKERNEELEQQIAELRKERYS